ncbi:MAG: helix-turn-helix transcriptional regulator [Ferruginibacter sp.]
MKSKNYISKEYKVKIGGNIRKWRNLKGIKQKELAFSLELSEAAISNIENDLTDVTLSQLEDLSLGLDVPVEQLFTDPQQTASTSSANAGNHDKFFQPLFEKELLNAVITSMQKKDEQIQLIMQNVLHTMSTLGAAIGSREA